MPGASEHGDVAVAALVRGMGAGRVGRGGGGFPHRRRFPARAAAQVFEPDLAGPVAALGGEQAGFVQQAPAKTGCSARGTRRCQLLEIHSMAAGVGIQARGQVDRQYRHRALGMRCSHCVMRPSGARVLPRPSRASMTRSGMAGGSSAIATPAALGAAQRRPARRSASAMGRRSRSPSVRSRAAEDAGRPRSRRRRCCPARRPPTRCAHAARWPWPAARQRTGALHQRVWGQSGCGRLFEAPRGRRAEGGRGTGMRSGSMRCMR